MPIGSYLVQDGSSPVLRKSPSSYQDWMEAIKRGETPDGRSLASISFLDVDDEGHLVNDFNEAEFVGKVTFIGWQFKECADGFVKLSPGSIFVHEGEAPPSIEDRGGVRISICPLP